MSICPISQTDPTAENFALYKEALDAKEQTLLEELPFMQDPNYLKMLGVELSKMLAMVGICQRGQAIKNGLSIRFIALEKLTHKCLALDEIGIMNAEQVAFLVSLLRKEETPKPLPIDIESMSPFRLKSHLEPITQADLGVESYKKYKECLDILTNMLPSAIGWGHMTEGSFLVQFGQQVSALLSEIDMPLGAVAPPIISIRFIAFEYLTRSSLTREVLHNLSSERAHFLRQLLCGEPHLREVAESA